ncbi:hypothetical protein [Absidia glauca]|uniref:Uncharacterized protein n=1 Tax=Absidia glauca TaxID=4829 RepID=A0A168KN43_ABSGL|nr:hypothetical protein [Absidia glauca]
METNNSLDPVTDPTPPQKDPECTVTDMDLSASPILDPTAAGTKDSTDQAQQSYSFYRYDWTDTNHTCLASTQTRYNLTIDESAALDRPLNASSQHSTTRTTDTNNFFKSCQWSPDGTCLLTNSEDRIIRVFDIPSSIYDPSCTPSLDLVPSLCIQEGESICDLAWFPSMNSQDPSTCCFLSSVRDHPVRLWDATTGKVRASYCVVNHREQFIGPNVLKFNLDGTKIYCGYENMIEIFHVHAPGNNTSTKISTTPNRKSRKGQKGIVSCLDFNPDQSGMYAAGSYSNSIGIYDERTDELCLKLTGMKGNGITQVKFSLDGHLLYSASRQSNSILCWDVRQSGNILYDLHRKGKTNQRITFDLDPTGSVLITGEQDGSVLTYDTTTMETEDVETKPRLLSSWQAHQDIVSGATFNPLYPSVMASCSGQRKFTADLSSDDDTSHSTDIIDNSLKVWQLPGQYEWYSMESQAMDITA